MRPLTTRNFRAAPRTGTVHALAMDPDHRELRAGQAGLPSETRQMAESDRIGHEPATPYALVLIVLAVAALVVLWLVSR